MEFPIEASSASIVMLGNFNPLIFTPLWFEKIGLIGADDAKKAHFEGKELEHRDILVYSLDWAQIQVQQNKFSVSVSEEPTVRLFDLVLGCFKRLRDTPITAMGINRAAHFKINEEDQWQAMGDSLAPKEPWGELLTTAEGERKGGLRSLVMKQSVTDKDNRERREDGLAGYVQIRVEPSQRVKPYGAFIEVNNHYEVEDPKNVIGCDEITSILESHWHQAIDFSDKVVKQIMELVP